MWIPWVHVKHSLVIRQWLLRTIKSYFSKLIPFTFHFKFINHVHTKILNRCRKGRNGWWKIQSFGCCFCCLLCAKKLNMNFKFFFSCLNCELRFVVCFFRNFFPLHHVMPCTTSALRLISILFLGFCFVLPKELYKHLNPNSWIFHANLNVLPEDLSFSFTVLFYIY